MTGESKARPFPPMENNATGCVSDIISTLYVQVPADQRHPVSLSLRCTMMQQAYSTDGWHRWITPPPTHPNIHIHHLRTSQIHAV